MSDVLSDAVFQTISQLIYEQSGIHFCEANRPILESRLRERLRLAELGTVEEYMNLIRRNEAEMKTFLDSITTNLTRFFRNQGHFDALVNAVLPDLVAHKRARNDRTLRVWSAGCSTGEEPYTLAMLLEDQLPADFSYDILASDLSLKSLMTANQGFYPENRVVGIPESYLKRFFTHTGEGYQVSDALRKKIKFDYHNLKFESGHRNLDIVFCRNVLIYFDEAAQKAVVDKFYQAMSPHSYLYIGHSESLFGMKTAFQFLKTDWAVLYTKILDGTAP